MVLKLGNQCVQMFRATLDSRIYSPVSILETWPTSYTVALERAARNTHMHPAPSTQHTTLHAGTVSVTHSLVPKSAQLSPDVGRWRELEAKERDEEGRSGLIAASVGAGRSRSRWLLAENEEGIHRVGGSANSKWELEKDLHERVIRELKWRNQRCWRIWQLQRKSKERVKNNDGKLQSGLGERSWNYRLLFT